MASEIDSKSPQNPVGEAAPLASGAAKAKGPKPKNFKEFMANRTAPEKTLISVSFFVFSALLLDYVVVQPVTQQLGKLNDEIKIEEKIIPKQLMILRHKKRVLGEYKNLKPFMTDPALTQEEETARLLSEIERVSKEANLFISNINPVKVEKKTESDHELSVDIEGKGGLSQIRQFMRSLETINPSIRFSGFVIKPISKDSDDLKCSFTIVKIGVKERSNLKEDS